MKNAMRVPISDNKAPDQQNFSNHVVHIRGLMSVEKSAFQDHLMRLDEESRYSRFGRPVNDDFLKDYAAKILGGDSVIKACFIDGVCRGVGEAIFTRGQAYDVEAAFSLEKRWQGHGLGTMLFQRLIRAVRNRGGRSICVLCLRSNQAMHRIAQNLGGEISVMPDGIVAEIHRKGSTIFSRQAEFFEDARFMFLNLPEDVEEPDQWVARLSR